MSDGSSELPTPSEAVEDAQELINQAKNRTEEERLEWQENLDINHEEDSPLIQDVHKFLSRSDVNYDRAPKGYEHSMRKLDELRKRVVEKLKLDQLAREDDEEVSRSLIALNGNIEIIMSKAPETYGSMEVIFRHDNHSPARGLIETLHQTVLLGPGIFTLHTEAYNYIRRKTHNDTHVISLISPDRNTVKKSTPDAIKTAELLLKTYLTTDPSSNSTSTA